MQKAINKACLGLQRLLDDAATNGANVSGTCECPEWSKETECDHTATLKTFAGFYKATPHHINRNGVQVFAYRVNWDAVIKRMQDIPDAAAESLGDYKTTQATCECADFAYRGGSYIAEDGQRICKHIHSLRQQAKVVPFPARPIPPLPDLIHA